MARVTLKPGFPVPRGNQGGFVFRDCGEELYWPVGGGKRAAGSNTS